VREVALLLCPLIVSLFLISSFGQIRAHSVPPDVSEAREHVHFERVFLESRLREVARSFSDHLRDCSVLFFVGQRLRRPDDCLPWL